MKNKKFLKKLTATALGLGLGASSISSVGAISPKTLWENHIQSQSKGDILKNYNQQIQPELSKNLSSPGDMQVAYFFLDGKIPLPSNGLFLDPQSLAIEEAHRVLNGKNLDSNDNNAKIFKEFVFQKLLSSQAEILEIKLKIKNKKNNIENNQIVPMNHLEQYSNYPEIAKKIDEINACKQNCLNIANSILNADASLQTVRDWQNYFNQSYDALQKNVKDAFSYINMIENNLRCMNMFNNPNNFIYGSLPNNNFNPFFANNMFGNFNPLLANNMFGNFNPFFANNHMPNNHVNAVNAFNLNNMSNNPDNIIRFNNNNQIINSVDNAAPVPIISNQVNAASNAQAKKALEDRFRRLSAGNQQIAGPCWLYATTTAINEFRDRNNAGPIIKRLSNNNDKYSPVENEYTKKGFDNPLSINAGGVNGKTEQDILKYARKQGIEARLVQLYADDYDSMGFNKDELVKLAAGLLCEHFKNNQSPVLVEAPWGAEFHELTIAGVVGNEILVVNSIGDSLTWQPIEKLYDYCKGKGAIFLSFVFFGGKEDHNSEHEPIYLASMRDVNAFNEAKSNLLRFARGGDFFNIKSLSN